MATEDIDWASLADEIGSHSATQERSSYDDARRAIEIIIGKSNIRNAVSVVLKWEAGSSLARSILRYIHSEMALEIAYYEYRNGEKNNAGTAVGLIKDICHPKSLDWVEEFLQDENVAIWGVGILDQLIWSHSVTLQEPKVARLLAMAELHHDESVRGAAGFIRDYITKRESATQ